MTQLRLDSARHRSAAPGRRHPSQVLGGATRPAAPPAWSVLCPEGTAFVDVDRCGSGSSRRWVRRLPAGVPVALVDRRPFSRLRLRRLARRSGLVVERELLLLPRRQEPMVVLDDAPASVRQFWTSVAAVPPGVARGVLPATLVVRAAAHLPWWWTGALAPGRVLLGRRR